MRAHNVFWFTLTAPFCSWATAWIATPTKTSTAAVSTHTYDLHWPLTPKNVTRFEHHKVNEHGISTVTTDVTFPEPVSEVTTEVAKRSAADVATVITSLASSAWVAAAAVCVVTGVATAGSACFAAVILAGLTTIWGLFLVTKDLGAFLENRAERHIVWDLHSDFHSWDNCSIRCQLETKSDQATWTHFANITIDGQKHQMHYWQNDSLRGLRVQQLRNSLTKRAPQPQETIYIETGYAQEGQLISTLYWVADSEEAKDELASDDLQMVANDFADYAIDNSMSMGCLDVGDSDGTVFQSVVMLDDSDEVWELAHDDILPTLNTCYIQDPYSTAPQ